MESELFTIQLNQWESDFFQKKIAQLYLTQAGCNKNAAIFSTILSKLSQYDLVQAKVSADKSAEIACLSQLGFVKVEGELDYCWQFPYLIADLSLAEESDIAALQQLCGTAFSESRFRQPWFSLEQNRRFYEKWIENAVKGTFDEVCLLEKSGEQIVGAISLRRDKLQSNVARVGLLVVAQQARGQGIATKLLQQAAYWCRSQAVSELWIATQQNNLQAQKLYEKCGANLQKKALWFYFVP